MCEYLSDRRLRQEIQEALNVIEQWNSVNGFIFHGKGGELLSNRPEDQEIALLSLHLIQVSLALVNTLMLQEVLAEGKWKAAMKQEDWRGLTPLFYQHVNPTGDSRSISRNVFLCHSPSSHRDITRDKTAPHLSTLRLRGSFLNAEPCSGTLWTREEMW
jgi:hypothetical protein